MCERIGETNGPSGGVGGGREGDGLSGTTYGRERMGIIEKAHRFHANFDSLEPTGRVNAIDRAGVDGGEHRGQKGPRKVGRLDTQKNKL